MKKAKLLVDTTFYMTPESIEKYNIDFINLYVIFEDKTFVENPINNETSEIFEKIKASKKIPKTSQPSSQNFLDAFQKQVDNGYDRIVVMTISSEFSGTYQGAILAAKLFMEENNNVQIDVFDSKLVVQGSSFAAFKVSEMIQENPNLSNDDIEKVINWYVNNIKIYLTVDKLDFLIYGGRVSKTIGSIGKFLKINPILQIKDGKLLEFAKVRSRKQALNKMLNEFSKAVDENPNQKFTALTAHAEDEQTAKYLSEKIQLKSNVNYIDGGEVGPVIGIHVGPGMAGMGWFPNVSNEEILKG